ncbi:MAG: thioesterase family protein [Thermoplasmata archaeon]|jgi:acyl-CoA thioester hydrolase
MNEFVYKYRVAWVDTDALGVMHFSNYFRICERTEEEFMRAIGLSFDPSHKVSLPRVKAECTFKYPLRYNDEAIITMKLKEIGRKHMKYSFEIKNASNDIISASCEIVVVAINDQFKSIELPNELIYKIKSFFNEN